MYVALTMVCKLSAPKRSRATIHRVSNKSSLTDFCKLKLFRNGVLPLPRIRAYPSSGSLFLIVAAVSGVIGTILTICGLDSPQAYKCLVISARSVTSRSFLGTKDRLVAIGIELPSFRVMLLICVGTSESLFLICATSALRGYTNSAIE